MPSVKWIKINIDMFDDEKIKIIQSMPEGDSLLVVWVRLITLAGKINDGGHIYISEDVPYTDEMLSVIMNKPITIIRLALETFNKLKMIDRDEKGIYLVNFDKHQSLEKLEKLKEQNRKRVAKYREKHKLPAPENNDESECNALRNVSCNGDVMQCNALDIDIDIDIDNKKERNIKERKKETSYDVIINEMVKDEEIQTMLYEFIKMRKLIKKPMTDRALKMLINKLNKISDVKEVQLKILESSIINNWQDVYPLKDNYYNQNANGQTKPKEKVFLD